MTWEALDELIERFDLEAHAGERLESALMSRDWRNVWSLSKEINEAFKTIRYPTRELRQAAWQRYEALRTEASRNAQEERDLRVRRSAEHRANILDLADRGTPKWHTGIDIIPLIEELKYLAGLVKEAGQYLSKHKQDMIGEHKSECFVAIQAAQKALDAWFASLNAARAERKQDWRARVESNIQKNREKYAEKAALLQSMESKADDLREKISTAWNEGFAERAAGWLSELEPKIEGLKDFLGKIEGWIEEDEIKLNK